MVVYFEQEYLQQLYETGKCKDKKHRFQPNIVTRFQQRVDFMIAAENITKLATINSLHYEKLRGDKEGLSSIRVNNQYRIEFQEFIEDGKIYATIVNITELSNHYQ